MQKELQCLMGLIRHLRQNGEHGEPFLQPFLRWPGRLPIVVGCPEQEGAAGLGHKTSRLGLEDPAGTVLPEVCEEEASWAVSETIMKPPRVLELGHTSHAPSGPEGPKVSVAGPW